MTAFQKAALALIGLIFAGSLYRAATASITTEEAITYNHYASQPYVDILTAPFDANNHLLHSVLCRVSTRLFGVSEFSLRIPSLLGGLLYLVGIYKLSELWLGAGGFLLASVALLGLNPVLLDYFSLARGYSLACALLVLGLYLLNFNRLAPAGLCLGLSAATQITFVIPAAGVCVAFLAAVRRWRIVEELLLPTTVTAGVFLAIPLTRSAVPQVDLDGTIVLMPVLIALGGIALAHSIENRFIRTRCGVLAGAIVIFYVTHMHFIADPDTKNSVNVLRAMHPSHEMKIGASLPLHESLIFYKRRYRLTEVAPLGEEGPDGAYDFYVLLPQDQGLIAKRNLKVIARRGEQVVCLR